MGSDSAPECSLPDVACTNGIFRFGIIGLLTGWKDGEELMESNQRGKSLRILQQCTKRKDYYFGWRTLYRSRERSRTSLGDVPD